MATVTRADPTDAVHRETGLRPRDAAELVDMAIEAIAERLSAGETVMISGFGSLLGQAEWSAERSGAGQPAWQDDCLRNRRRSHSRRWSSSPWS